MRFLVGGAYTNIKYDFGRSHAPTAIIGYRRYVWRHVHLEYQLWPSFGLYGGHKPQSFKDKASAEPVFTAPMVFVGWRF
jgi:hypothetical protein